VGDPFFDGLAAEGSCGGRLRYALVIGGIVASYIEGTPNQRGDILKIPIFIGARFLIFVVLESIAARGRTIFQLASGLGPPG